MRIAIYQCDRCGVHLRPGDPGWLELVMRPLEAGESATGPGHLCPVCVADYRRFMAGAALEAGRSTFEVARESPSGE